MILALTAVLGPVLSPPVSAAQAAPGAPQAPAAPLPLAPGAAPTAPATAQPTACTPQNIIRTALVTGSGLKGGHPRIRDGRLATEGAAWNAAHAVQLTDARAELVIDLRRPRSLQHLLLQADNNDRYLVEASDDGQRYRRLWMAPVAPDQGLRTRIHSLPQPQTARYLRIRGVGGDNFYSISEFRAHCEKPKPWPPKLTYPPKKVGWAAIDNPMMVFIKGALAGLGTLLLLGGLWLARRRPERRRLRRAYNVLLGLIGLISLASWWNLGHFHFDHYIHIWEHYHYYMGAKYGPELRFSRLYECTAAADLADGRRTQVIKRKMRDLADTNKLGTTAAIVADPGRCTRHFSEERWNDFRRDNRHFRSRFSKDRWDQSQGDHGYNATPVWAILGRLIADWGPLSKEKIDRIAIIDTVILLAMWLAVLWAFGWQAACVALIYWGCNFPARFYWNGGSFLRYDWQLWLVVGICLLKKRYPFGAGLSLTYATLLRVFPGFVVAAVILKVLYRMVRERRFVLTNDQMRFAAGCIVAMAVLFPASSWAMGGLDAWGEFAENSEKHLATALTNNMGLKTVMGYDPGTRAKVMRNNDLDDPFAEWKQARAHYYSISKPIMLGVVLLFCFLLARAGDRGEDWEAACLGAGLIVMAVELTCYYYGFLLTYGLLWQRRKLPGILAAALASVTCMLSELPWNDDHFGAMSLASVLTVIAVTAHAAYGRSSASEPLVEGLEQQKSLAAGDALDARQRA